MKGSSPTPAPKASQRSPPRTSPAVTSASTAAASAGASSVPSATVPGSSAAGAAPSSAPSVPSTPLTAEELEAAFSFLPHLHDVLHALQFSTEPKQTQQATDSLLSHIARARSLLQTLPAITISAVEQQREFERLLGVREKKKALAEHYRLLPSDAPQSASERRPAAPDAAVKTEAVVSMKDE